MWSAPAGDTPRDHGVDQLTSECLFTFIIGILAGGRPVSSRLAVLRPRSRVAVASIVLTAS